VALMTAVRSLTFPSLGGEVELFAIEPAEPLEATADWIRGLHDRLTRFEPVSELSRFNARAGEWVDVSPVLHDLLLASLKAFEESEGLVNVAILPALLATGYDRTFEEIAGRGVSASSTAAFRQRNAAIWQQDVAERQRAAATWQGSVANTLHLPKETLPPGRPVGALHELLQVMPGRARLAAGAAIDLGGIAKGWIADRAVERLGPNSLVSCGGDLHARGGGETGDGWPVGFGDRTLLLKDMAAATSGTSKRRWGDGLHHLIDPRTGAPSTSDLTEVSVLADNALDAEIFAKTAFLLGSTGAERYLAPRSKGWALS
jgi:thiamine biosynthesis lipoprotein